MYYSLLITIVIILYGSQFFLKIILILVISIYIQYLNNSLQNISNCNKENGIIETLEFTVGFRSFKISM